ncbi:MAG: methyltransferase domain-containing protein [Nanoarchaeota archaeon]
MRKMNSKQIAEKYDLIAKWYDFCVSIIEVLGMIGLRKKLIGKARGKVLEIGIGTGRNLRYYNKECEIIGIDYSEEMLKIAKKRADKSKMNVKLIKMDAEKLNFRKVKFDSVVDTLGLCTYSNPIKVLKEMKRVVKKNGKILLLEHGESNNKFIRKLQGFSRESHYEKSGCNLLRNHEELVRKAGLKIVKIERKFFGIFYLIEART